MVDGKDTPSIWSDITLCQKNLVQSACSTPELRRAAVGELNEGRPTERVGAFCWKSILGKEFPLLLKGKEALGGSRSLAERDLGDLTWRGQSEGSHCLWNVNS